MNAPATTAALLTAPARGGIAVIGLTGPAAGEVLAKVFRARGAAPGEGRLSLGAIVDGDEVLDEATVSLTAGGAAEINIHGGPHVARKVLTLLADRGATVRADSGPDPTLAPSGAAGLDNPAIAEEMLSALRLASTPLAVSAVTAQWFGGLSALAAEEHPAAGALRSAAGALPLMERLLAPAEVVIAGPPNAGKSALANALVGRNVSIVSETAGTTRDWVRSRAEVEGVPVWLTDTAGLWAQDAGLDELDRESVERAWHRIERADVVICLTAGPVGASRRRVERLRALPNVICVAGKCDLRPAGPAAELAVSAVTLTGLGALGAVIGGRLGFVGFDAAAAMAFTRRQAGLLAAAADAVDRADTEAAEGTLELLLAGEAKKY